MAHGENECVILSVIEFLKQTSDSYLFTVTMISLIKQYVRYIPSSLHKR
jgi:hypothetical protein